MLDDKNIRFPASKKFVEVADIKHLIHVIRELTRFFEGNEFKVAYWLSTPNPMLGGLIPFSLIILGRGHKVVQFIEAAKGGNIE